MSAHGRCQWSEATATSRATALTRGDNVRERESDEETAGVGIGDAGDGRGMRERGRGGTERDGVRASTWRGRRKGAACEGVGVKKGRRPCVLGGDGGASLLCGHLSILQCLGRICVDLKMKEAHPPGAINVQIYRLIKEWTARDIARRAAFAFFGIFTGTEENPEFVQSVESKLDKDAKIIVACSTGGTMKPSQSLPEGLQSRSLIAAYLLVLNGYKNVFHLEGGLYKWFKEGLPAEAEEE
ncbi:hypothetical protein ZIOFF_044459 [Zingiber officinale]|uniref:Rhodanese domain-containing protein n=1 Tax=Zingiber officinale TaxID=94328 RepID=A0A8J5FZ50_ZINOF|nr:hypothetical protein ZIOFF_044459 [Zingiber officinale]